MPKAQSNSVSPPCHLVVGTPCYGGQVTHHYLISALDLQLACIRRGIALSFKVLGNDSLVPRARNLIVSQFLDDPAATHLIFIDADLGFAPDQVFALLDADLDVAGAVYPMKKMDWALIAETARTGLGKLPGAALNYVVDLVDPDHVRCRGRFLEVRHIGTGFLMIRRKVFEDMALHYPELRFNGTDLGANRDLASANTYDFFECMIDPETRAYLSEDYGFCRRWRAMGGEIWADGASRLTHVGTVPFEGNLPDLLARLALASQQR
jgi:hypothetical protein